MLFTAPIPFREALRRNAARELLPTTLDTAGLRKLGQTVLNNSFFSARNELTDLLGAEKSQVDELIGGVTDFATARLRVKEMAQRISYQPDPEKRGTILDLSSTKRIDLVLQTNTQMMQSAGWDIQGQAPEILDEWPAQELYRAEDRRERRDWLARFRLAGSQTGDPIGTGWTLTEDGRMIALKNHPIWDKLGDPGLFKDGLGNPFAPYA